MLKTNHTFTSPINRTGARAGWVGRIPSISTTVNRDEAVRNLTPSHLKAVHELNPETSHFYRCEQTHSNQVVAITDHAPHQSSNHPILPTADGLCTNLPNTTLGIYVADCGAIYLSDPIKKAVALLHSGKVGTQKNILEQGILAMQTHFNSEAKDIIVSLSPCIRPPAYEIDFAQTIAQQALEAGILKEHYHDCQTCTTSSPDQFYSYRQEKGKTGRMLALISL